MHRSQGVVKVTSNGLPLPNLSSSVDKLFQGDVTIAALAFESTLRREYIWIIAGNINEDVWIISEAFKDPVDTMTPPPHLVENQNIAPRSSNARKLNNDFVHLSSMYMSMLGAML